MGGGSGASGLAVRFPKHQFGFKLPLAMPVLGMAPGRTDACWLAGSRKSEIGSPLL